MEAKKLALLCRELADNKKAENIVILDVSKISSVTDYFVIATGTSEPHVRAIINEIEDRLRTDHEVRSLSNEGGQSSGWVVLDYFDVIVHIMRPEVRDQYDLEGLWKDAKPVKPKVTRRKKAAAKSE